MKKVTCPDCNGSKVYEAEGSTYTERCMTCHGKGHIYKPILRWVKEAVLG